MTNTTQDNIDKKRKSNRRRRKIIFFRLIFVLIILSLIGSAILFAGYSLYNAGLRVYDEFAEMYQGYNDRKTARMGAADPKFDGYTNILILGVDDAEIAQAIYRHTVGARDMTPLDKIIYFADMIEPNRDYPGVERLRNLSETAHLDEILLTAFSETIAFVIRKQSLIHPDTVAARNFLILNS